MLMDFLQILYFTR